MKFQLIKRTDRLRRLAAQTGEKLRQTQNLRLMTGGIFFLTLIFAAVKPEWRIELVSVPVFLSVFPYFVIKSRRLARFKGRLENLAAFSERQNRRRQGKSVERDWQAALALIDESASERLTAGDLGLIGPHSLFSLLDETVTDGGRHRLVEWIASPALTREHILERQSLVAKLESERWFFTKLLLIAGETDWKLSSQIVLDAVRRSFFKDGIARLIQINLVVWLLCLLGFVFSLTTGFASPVWFFMIAMAMNLFVLNQIGPVFKRGEGLAHHLSGLVPVFASIEGRLVKPVFRELLQSIEKARPSKGLKRFNTILAFLSTESHPLINLFVNLVAPWSAVFTWLIEGARRDLAGQIPECLEEFHHLEALMCLVFLRVYQTKNVPEIVASAAAKGSVFSAREIYHPLIDRSMVVANDFEFPAGKRLGLLTGSNMSGKSTFLRTIGVNQVLANMGATVFATQMKTSVMRLGTCIQVSDSLRDGFSYFYAEVLRLKSVIDQVHASEPVLFMIDEIFRGTNNRERQIGSRAVIRSLTLGEKSLGFVSTHDLELTSLEESLPAIMNLHFREDFENGEMRFHYRLQHGPCPTTNALKIMEKAGLDLS